MARKRTVTRHNTEFGERIRKVRIARGLSQDELAEKTGMTQAAISFMEVGQNAFASSLKLKELAKALKVPIDTLLLDEGETIETEPVVILPVHDLNDSAVQLYWLLKRHAQDDGVAEIHPRMIAEEMGVSQATVMRRLDELKDANIIAETVRFHPAYGNRGATVYVVLDMATEFSPEQDKAQRKMLEDKRMMTKGEGDGTLVERSQGDKVERELMPAV